MNRSSAHVVLVHGAWANASSWNRVGAMLEARGAHVLAVELALSSIAGDAAIVRRAAEGLRGPIVLAGHSYGGMVMTAAGRDLEALAGLVYVAAFAPDEHETMGDIIGRFPSMTSAKDLRPDADGLLTIQPERFGADFAADVDAMTVRSMAKQQRPLHGTAFSERAGPPAWRQRPCWYAISESDRMLHPEAQRWMAERIEATTIALPASHASLVSQPAEIAEMILDAVLFGATPV